MSATLQFLIRNLNSLMFIRIHFGVCAKLLQSCPTLCDSMNCTRQAPLSMGFSRQKYWSELPFPFPGDLPNPGFEPASLVSLGLADRFFTTSTSCSGDEGREDLKLGLPTHDPNRSWGSGNESQSPITEFCTSDLNWG